MTIGSKIRYHRVRKNLTQEELAKGVLSVSYLSKIENNQINASQEILDLLCNRLGIENIEQSNEIMKQALQNWNKALLRSDIEESKRLRKILQTTISDADEFSILTGYQILLIRFHLLMNNLDEASRLITDIHHYYKDLSDQLKFYYRKFTGNYYYATKKYDNAIEHFKEAEHLFMIARIPQQEEKADLFYRISLALVQLRKHTTAIIYSEKSLDLYQSLYHNKRCAEVHLLLGVCYRRTHNIDEALFHYEWANEISKTNRYTLLRGNVEQNLGYLKSTKGLTDEAIVHYLTSLGFKNEHNESKLSTLVTLVKEYYKLNQFDEMNKWLKEGFLIATKTQYPAKYYQLKIYEYLANGFSEEFEQFMVQEALPYFEKHGNPHHIAQFSKFLGQYYQEIRKYKYAAHYLTKANAAYENILGD
ncbi:tetratricopeptide (TPR) repeat protein [Bacillus pakistanensis]|uniref:Tetratricopeptide (TPR) repeat protein n=1 Tax=Rossellomorea pakistanensis TaxID=992288 RepID=A0ABS2N876_9BACI|nr:helix-turn-helix transcriptional regulator [Bacillus pakistanensis]MBM7584060.1 tetratricopeptide (TPR) repeat protein [Bacillus pakistanensis]